MSKKKYHVRRFDEIDPVDCPCGKARRAFAEESERLMSLHRVDISRDSRKHYHKCMTETYYVLSGAGIMELDDDAVPLEPGISVMIRPGCRHRAIGDLQILNICIPAFDAGDEFED
ncbi:MAG: cupin domain-containing protein [Oscillospiraceae bacterium]|nr:cupin domain-containing protein [Oscillospiraceae bacterium]